MYTFDLVYVAFAALPWAVVGTGPLGKRATVKAFASKEEAQAFFAKLEL